MESMRATWTDERMDDLNGRVDELSSHMDARFDSVDRRFEVIDHRFDLIDQLDFDTALIGVLRRSIVALRQSTSASTAASTPSITR